MPRLILRADDGRELLGFDVSPERVHAVESFLRKHWRGFEYLAAMKRGYEQAIAAVAPAAPRRRVRR